MSELRSKTLTRPTSTDTADHGDTWRDQTACRGVDPEVFFTPNRGNPGKDDTDPWGEARAYCHACPVAQACLDAALREERRNAGRYGMRGGRAPDERRYHRTAGRPTPAPEVPGLTARQRDIVDLLEQGLTHGQIGGRLGIASGTVSTTLGRLRASGRYPRPEENN